MAKAVKSAADIRAELKEFRHNLSILKKKGVVPKSVDARSQVITRHYKEQIKKNLAIIEGRETTVKLSKAKIQEYKSGGHRTVGHNRVIVQKQQGEKVRVSHGEVYVTRKLKNGETSRVVLPVSFNRLDHWINGAEDPYLESLKNKGESFAFRYFGNNSVATFHNFEQMRRQFEKYKSFTGAIEKGRGAEAEILQHIEVVRTTVSPTQWEAEASANDKEKRKRRRAYHKARIDGTPVPRALRGPDKAPRKVRETPARPKNESGITAAKTNAQRQKEWRNRQDAKKNK
jgi:hypothetical protein